MELVRVFLAVLVVLALGSCSGNGWEPIGEAREVTYEELDSSVTEAAHLLLQESAVEAVEQVFVEEERGRAIWVDFRPGTGFALVDVKGNVNTSVFGMGRLGATLIAEVRTREARYLAPGEGSHWQVDEVEPEEPLPRPFVLARLDQKPAMIEPLVLDEATEMTRQETSDGGTVWTLASLESIPFDRQSWFVHPDGHLRGYVATLEGAGEDQVDGRLETTYRSVANPEPLPEPEPGSELDLGIFNVPREMLSDQ